MIPRFEKALRIGFCLREALLSPRGLQQVSVRRMLLVFPKRMERKMFLKFAIPSGHINDQGLNDRSSKPRWFIILDFLQYHIVVCMAIRKRFRDPLPPAPNEMYLPPLGVSISILDLPCFSRNPEFHILRGFCGIHFSARFHALQKKMSFPKLTFRF